MRTDGRGAGVRRFLLAEPVWWRELAVIGALFGVYRSLQAVVHVDLGPAYARAGELLHIERVLGIDVELGANRILRAHDWMVIAANYWYVLLHGAVTSAVLLWLFRRHRGVYPAGRLSIAAATVSAFAVFTVAPCAPPRLVPGAGYVDTLAHWHTLFSYDSGMIAATADQFAALPSLHIAWGSWAALYVHRTTRRWPIRAAGFAYPAVTALVVVATANHWVLDVAGGLIVFGLGELVRTTVVNLPTVPGRARYARSPRPGPRAGAQQAGGEPGAVRRSAVAARSRPSAAFQYRGGHGAEDGRARGAEQDGAADGQCQ